MAARYGSSASRTLFTSAGTAGRNWRSCPATWRYLQPGRQRTNHPSIVFRTFGKDAHRIRGHGAAVRRCVVRRRRPTGFCNASSPVARTGPLDPGSAAGGAALCFGQSNRCFVRADGCRLSMDDWGRTRLYRKSLAIRSVGSPPKIRSVTRKRGKVFPQLHDRLRADPQPLGPASWADLGAPYRCLGGVHFRVPPETNPSRAHTPTFHQKHRS